MTCAVLTPNLPILFIKCWLNVIQFIQFVHNSATLHTLLKVITISLPSNR